MIGSLSLLFFFLFLGEIASSLLKLSMPGNVIGMILLLVTLRLKWISLHHVKPAADVLVKNLSFLFVPPGVGLMLYFDLIQKEYLAIGLSLVVSTFIMLFVTGWLQQKLER